MVSVALLLAALLPSLMVGTSPVEAAGVSTPGTMFEIDGNVVVDSTGDWPSTAEEYPALLGRSFTEDPCGEANTPGDLCGVWRAYELVVADSGDRQVVLYGAWARTATLGGVEVLFPLDGPDAASVDDDVIIRYSFLDSTQTTQVDVLRHDGTDWAPTSIMGGSLEAATSTGATMLGDHLVDIGEFAINLSVNGLLPPEGPCTRHSDVVSSQATGDQALLDSVALPTLSISSCRTDVEGPAVVSMDVAPDPIAHGGDLTVIAAISDSDTGGSPIASATVTVDGGTPVSLTASDGAFDEIQESVDGQVAATPSPLPAVVDVCIRATDAAGNTGPGSCRPVMVFDASSSGVYGIGSIDSPGGAVAGDPTVVGAAHLQFHSTYAKGRFDPSGAFALDLPDGRQVRSTDLTQLKVAKGGTSLELTGTADIDDAPGYAFTVSGVDGSQRGRGDTIRIRITGPAGVVYDTGSLLPLGAGGIVIDTGR
jgi:hypothetical protein